MNPHLSIQAVRQLQNEGIGVLVDVRTPSEFSEIHIEGSRLAPLERLTPEEIRHFETGGRQCIFVCRSGKRAEMAADRLLAFGFGPYAILEGGVDAWEKANLPVNRGRKTWSLECQARTAAGLLVLISVALGALLHPALYSIAALVGLGLVLSGVSDRLNPTRLLAKAPWNQPTDPQNPTHTTCSAQP